MFLRLIFSSFFLVLHFMGTPVNAMGYNSSDYWRSDELFKKGIVSKEVLQELWGDVQNVGAVLNYKKLSPEAKNRLGVKDQLVDLYAKAWILNKETSAKKVNDTTGEELLETIYSAMRQFVSYYNNHFPQQKITVDQLRKAGRDKANTQKDYIKRFLLGEQWAPTISQIPHEPEMMKTQPAKQYDPARKVITGPQE